MMLDDLLSIGADLLTRDGDLSDFGLYLAGMSVVALMLVAIGMGA